MNESLFMERALELARRGEGYVEPNPMVGAVVVQNDKVVGEGFHRQHGGPHAEVHALADAGTAARGATLYVTLEPCCHTGKTPPCTEAVLQAGIAKVVVAMGDPFPQVDGAGIAQLREAGVECECGLLQNQARRLLAPYVKLITTGQPWVIAKWAMTLDGKIATHTGSSQWITNTESRKKVHELRGRMDAIIVGSATARSDDPLLTARPAGPRVATRIVLGELSPESQLAKTLDQAPLMLVVRNTPKENEYDWLIKRGGELLVFPDTDHVGCIEQLLHKLGQRRMTNILVEGGGLALGSLLDASAVDEVHAYIAPKIIGGLLAPTPIAGKGIVEMGSALQLSDISIESIGTDVCLKGRIQRDLSTRA